MLRFKRERQYLQYCQKYCNQFRFLFASKNFWMEMGLFYGQVVLESYTSKHGSVFPQKYLYLYFQLLSAFPRRPEMQRNLTMSKI